MWPTLATALQTRVFRAKLWVAPKNTIFIEVHDEFVNCLLLLLLFQKPHAKTSLIMLVAQ